MKSLIVALAFFSGVSAYAWEGAYSCDDGLELTIVNGYTNIDGVRTIAEMRPSNVSGHILVNLYDANAKILRGHECQELAYQH